MLDVDCELTFGGGWFRKLVSSLGGGGGGGGEDTDGDCLVVLLFVAFFGAELLAFPLGGRVYELSAGGGGGRTRVGPFIGRYGVLSASEEGLAVRV